MFRVTVIAALVLPAFAFAEPRVLVFGGEETTEGKYPYYTDLIPDRDNACGGTLVAPDMILSHPQCLPLLVEATVGWYNRNNPNVDVLNIIEGQEPFVHPNYDPFTFEYGLMLLQLDGTSGNAIPRLNSDPNVPAADTPLTVIGRGNTESGGLGNLQNTLHEAFVPFITTETCEMARSDGGWTYEDLIGDSLFCAGSDDFGSCEDDWGSPMVVKDASPFNDVVVGVTSWTFGCGPTPSVYSRVSEGYDWLRFTICENSVDPPTYLNCASASTPPASDMLNPPNPTNPINFKWTFTPDDFNFENAYTLERVEGLSVRKVDYIVPGGIPYGLSSTFERTVSLEKNALYVVSISDTRGDGLNLDDGGAEFFLEKDDGTFEMIHEEDETFSDGVSYLFYATLDEVEDPYFGFNAYANSSAFLELEIEFDDYPWEIGLQLETEDGEVILYRPPRYWFSQRGQTYSEMFAVPEGETNYKLTVVDTYGDGLLQSQTHYRILTPDGDVLVESQFRDSGEEEKTFSYRLTGDGRFAGAAGEVNLGMLTVSALVGLFLCL
mmetsp:Transcript_4000/g.7995  ORF Transcript_4000/g.7995 Transcript_4000/m.7995 type:complete len:550 (-) Transcript_4000:84-1733(-)